MLTLRLYPALLLLYTGGIAAIASENYPALLKLFMEPKHFEPQLSERLPAVQVLSAWGEVLHLPRSNTDLLLVLFVIFALFFIAPFLFGFNALDWGADKGQRVVDALVG